MTSTVALWSQCVQPELKFYKLPEKLPFHSIISVNRCDHRFYEVRHAAFVEYPSNDHAVQDVVQILLKNRSDKILEIGFTRAPNARNYVIMKIEAGQKIETLIDRTDARFFMFLSASLTTIHEHPEHESALELLQEREDPSPMNPSPLASEL